MDQAELNPNADISQHPSREEQQYWTEGADRARSLDNRGRLRFDETGQLHPEIREAYDRTGFYIFEHAIDAEELSEFDRDLAALLECAPSVEGSAIDRSGQPAVGTDGGPTFLWAQALSDPWGGTELLNGRHPVAMQGPSASTRPSEKSIFLVLNLFEEMPAALSLSAHPQLLRVAESLNGTDFVPYNDSIFLKEPGLGAAVAWHQDGTTHWNQPDWHPDIHGFNFMAQLCPTTPANALWVVPGSHREGRINIQSLTAKNNGSTRLPDAVPMLCDRGDVVVCNRQCLHGSFANASQDRRATFVWGFFRRDSVLDAEVDIPSTKPGQKRGRRRYSEADIQSRVRIIQLAIAARNLYRPDEEPYSYRPLQGQPEQLEASASIKTALQAYSDGTIFI